MCSKTKVAARPEGTNVFNITAQQPPQQILITNEDDSRVTATDRPDLDSVRDYPQALPEFSEKIPEVWKNANFEAMPFSIEKCRDLK
jgi:hypothetical protein